VTSAQRAGVAALFVVGTVLATGLAVLVAPGGADNPEIAVDDLGDATTSTAPTSSAPTSSVPATTGPATTGPATTGPATTTSPIRPVPVLLAPGPHAPILSRIDTTDPVVFLTIDDGLVQDPAVVEWLRTEQVPVTIFPTPPYVNQNPAFFESIHALGASVQDHTVNHKNLTTLPATEQAREICDVLPQFQARFGERPWMMRPPGGAVNSSVQYAARTCGLRAIVLWRATMNDGRLDTQGGELQRGDIVLLHFRDDLLHNLEVGTAAAEAKGLRPARLEEYLTPG
jgi:peptidoglycan/xylan/chitin deacetylase (PgdA/CDA1 family)